MAFLLPGLWYFRLALYGVIALCGLAGIILAALTREDAFSAAGRQSKWVWVGLLVFSTFMVATLAPFLSWIGIVLIGLYWWDVRPQLRDILRGEAGW